MKLDNTKSFFMLDGTFEYQKEIADRIASGLPLESIAEYFERNGIEIPENKVKREWKREVMSLEEDMVYNRPSNESHHERRIFYEYFRHNYFHAGSDV